MWQKLRISLLLYLLILVATMTWWSKVRTTSWDTTLPVIIHPINADSSKVADKAIDRLDDESFYAIQKFFTKASENYELPIDEPFSIFLGSTLAQGPPERPRTKNPLRAILWSLQLRWHNWRLARSEPATIRIFLRYYDAKTTPRLGHSTGLQKGLVGVVNAFAQPSYRGSNNVVIAHELLHTVGATDKYNREGYPLYPEGFANPEQSPRYPQRQAELMGGRIPLSSQKAVIPKSLRQMVIGQETASEIGWNQ